MKKITFILLGLIFLTAPSYADVVGNQVILKRTDCSSITQNGLGCYDTDDHTLCFGNGSTCEEVGGSSGSGDVTSVGDCASGACNDGSSDGGTYIRLYDGDSNYGALLTANLTGNRTYTFPNFDATVASLAGAETLTNKTLAAADNVIEADSGDSATSFFSTGSIERARTLYPPAQFNISNPTSASDKGKIHRWPYAITITAIHANVTGGTSVVGQLQECDSNGLNCVDVDSDMTVNANTNTNDDGSLSNPSIAANNYVGVKTTSVTGAVTDILWTYEYTVN